MGKKKQEKKSPKKQAENAENLTLEEVLALGGSEDDLALLKDLDGGEEDALDDKEDLDAEPINRDDVRNLLNELGIVKAREEFLSSFGDKESKKKKKKEKESQPEEQAVKSFATDGSSGPKVKKVKNKFKVQEPEVSSTVPDTGKAEVDYLSTHQPRTYLLVKPGSKWHSQQFEGDPTGIHDTPEKTCRKLKEFAAVLYQDEINLYKKQTEQKKRSESAWMRTVLTAGTTADRLAALTLQVQDAAVQNLAGLQALVGMVGKKGGRQALSAMDTLQELFLSELLPEGRKLRTFDQRPLQDIKTLSSGNHDARDKRLLLWYFEEQLKQLYAEFIEAVKTRCHDNIAATKRKALGVLVALLMDKPENEKILLSALVNKLGDQMAKMAAYVVHLLKRLVQQHPNMKKVVVTEVEQLLYRSHVSDKAGYNGVCFLNQLELSHEEKDLAARLILLFFSFFKAYIKKNKVDSRMLSALLTGVNRAFPYAKVEQERIQEQLDTLYQVVHLTKFNTSVQALMLLYQVMDTSDKATDRYYQALYRKLQDPSLMTSSKQNMFLNLLYKSMRKDVVDKRVKAFIRRTLQVCCEQSPQFTCGALFLLSEVLAERPGLLNLKQSDSQDQLVEDDDEEHFTDIAVTDDRGRQEADSSATSESEDEELPKKPSWVHLKNLRGKASEGPYDPHQRNPLFCRADQDSVWELHQLALHYHPTVTLFANKILQGERIAYSGDPLQDFTLIRFLDRFVYRNPKKKQQSDATALTFLSRKKDYVASGVKGLAVNSEEFLLQDEKNVPEDEKFFYKYFTEQKKTKPGDDESEGSDVSDDEFDQFLDDYEKEVGLDGDASLEADFAGEFKRPEKKGSKEMEEDSDLDDEDEDLSDEEPDFSDDEEMQAAFLGDDSDEMGEEDVSFSDNDELAEFEGTQPGKKKARRSAADDVFLDGPPPSKKKRARHDESSLFAAAEDFGDLIEENMGSKVNTGGSEALSNRDKADAKQLKWEQDRDEWVRGVSWKQKKRKHGGGKAGGGRGAPPPAHKHKHKHSKPGARNRGAQSRKRKK